MKVLIVPDKFKGSLTTFQICDIVADELIKANPYTQVIKHPMADGGDGSVEVLNHYIGMERVNTFSLNSYLEPIGVHYYRLGNVAYIELATCSGLAQLPEVSRTPLYTSTYGTGRLILSSMNDGCDEIHLFLGGSATHDCGTGILSALGFSFWDEDGGLISPMGKSLLHISKVTRSSRVLLPKLKMICDVTNPLLGEKGAAHTFAQQKGASLEDLELLESGTLLFSTLVGIDRNTPMMGAAGGVPCGIMGLMPAEIVHGFEYLSEISNLEDQIKQADLVISGEGSFDEQSLDGKLVSGVLGLSKKYNKSLHLFVGKSEISTLKAQELGIERIASINTLAKNYKDSMANAAKYLQQLARNWAHSYLQE